MIADYLKFVEGNAVSVDSICSMTGLTDREIRACVARERKAGILIGTASHGGYFLCNRRDEIERFARASAAREKTARQVSKPFRDALKKLDEAAQVRLCPDP